jgi:hypothetical protein
MNKAAPELTVYPHVTALRACDPLALRFVFHNETADEVSFALPIDFYLGTVVLEIRREGDSKFRIVETPNSRGWCIVDPTFRTAS